MAEMVGGAFLTVVFEKLFEQLASPELRKNSVAVKLKMLGDKLEKVRLYLDDAEDKQLFDKKVKEWLDKLKHVVFMADDLVEEITDSKKEKKYKRKAVVRAIKSVYQSLAKTDQGEIDLILTDLDGLFDQALVLELKHVNGGDAQSSRSSPAIIAPLREEHHVFGRDAEKEKILEMLLSEEDKIGVLPIVGMGGLGKTTLAQLVYGDKRVEKHGFTLKAWVTVSTEFDFYRIIKELLQKVKPGTSTSDINDPNELQRLMKEAVRGKKFLFVLDDVWEENYNSWDPLMTSFTTGDCRSRIIVTTRSSVVGSKVKTRQMYEPEKVGDDDCWSIFVHHAFNGDRNSDPKLQDIGRRIVVKCKGLPLAVTSIGGLLRSERNPQKWENILRSHVWEWSRNQKENGVLPSLWLSYRYLPSSLKQCFAYCSLFPQDYEFDKKRLVLLWMAEGFLPSDDMEEVGEQYFDDLVSRSLFQRSSGSFVMHDLVHDLAAFVYGQFCFRKEDDLKNVTIRTRHFLNSDESSEKDNDLLMALSTAKHLRTIIGQDQFGSPLSISEKFSVKEMATKMRCLRVLSVSLRRSVSHHSLGDLKMLRFLDLSGSEVEELSDSICSLFHLQTLILRHCENLTRLPTEMRKLIKLRHLHMGNLKRLEKLPPNMGNLKELRILMINALGEADDNGCSTLKELGELKHLRKLDLGKLENVRNLEDVQNANILRDKAEMKELTLKWHGRDEGSAVDVLEALRPHTNLESLEVSNYRGSSFPKWVGETSFSKMVYVVLSGGGNSCCRFLPPLGQLPSLRKLRIVYFEGVEKIGNEFLYGNDSSSITPFPCLQRLSFYNMSSWEEWSFVGSESGCFPRLQSLIIIDCWKLKSITEDDMQSTKSLFIRDCRLLERRYQKYKGDGWPYISHIPQVDIRGWTTYKLKEETEETEENSASESE